MKRSIYLALMALMLSGLSACTSYNYYTAAINKTNLSNYHTFAWMPQTNNGKKMANDQADSGSERQPQPPWWPKAYD